MPSNDNNKAIKLGHPSYVWRFGQDRRFALIQQYAPLENRRVLDVGCGVGMYVHQFRAVTSAAYGVDVDFERVREAREISPLVCVSAGETLPFPTASFDVVMLHEVIEHLDDDYAGVHEAYRILKAGGRLIIFAPNRLYFFETHGAYWRGEYHFGNIPLVNYLPDPLRDEFCPHVRAYTTHGIYRLFEGLDYKLIVHDYVFPGYDNIAARRPRLARLLRGVTYAMENTPLRIFGLSHFVVIEKSAR